MMRMSDQQYKQTNLDMTTLGHQSKQTTKGDELDHSNALATSRWDRMGKTEPVPPEED
jgi:hypothetical protein